MKKQIKHIAEYSPDARAVVALVLVVHTHVWLLYCDWTFLGSYRAEGVCGLRLGEETQVLKETCGWLWHGIVLTDASC